MIYYFMKRISLFFLMALQVIFISAKDRYTFEVSVKDTALHLYHVILSCKTDGSDTMEFRMANWTPGYYQLMHYAEKLQDFKAMDSKGKALQWVKSGENAWKIIMAGNANLKVEYDILAKHRFVAGNYLDGSFGYISPAGVFIYPFGKIHEPVSIKVKSFSDWVVASGMDADVKDPNQFVAADFDVLFDSPILWGAIETFPSFKVRGIQHDFKAIKAGAFDRKVFMNELKKMIMAASDIIGEIPYKHYTFLAMGPGGGGIEHLNSASIAFNGEELNRREGKIRTMNFLAHEYFHHYNVKRIRPIELGPFDYDHGSSTSMLWFSEGVTVYYEYLILKRAGITTEEELLESFRQSIQSYLNKEGRKYQSPSDASLKTWEEGAFGRTQDKINKTISVYDKGPLLGIMLDFKIRHETNNQKSLDDLMRLLYNKYYKKLNRGFTEQEFRNEVEHMAGDKMDEFFEQVYTTKEINYNLYLELGGIRLEVSDVSPPEENKAPSKNFQISKMENMTALQSAIFNSWSR